MTINYKHKFFIYHPDGKFTEAQIKEMLDAAYKAGHDEGYNDGYSAGKNSNWTITYQYPNYYDWNKATCNSTITTASTTLSNNNNSSTKDALKDFNKNTLEFRYNGTEK